MLGGADKIRRRSKLIIVLKNLDNSVSVFEYGTTLAARLSPCGNAELPSHLCQQFHAVEATF